MPLDAGQIFGALLSGATQGMAKGIELRNEDQKLAKQSQIEDRKMAILEQEATQKLKTAEMENDPDSPAFKMMKNISKSYGVEIPEGMTPSIWKTMGISDILKERSRQTTQREIAEGKLTARGEKLKQGKILPSSTTTSLSDMDSSISQLGGVSSAIDKYSDLMGPVAGRPKAFSPYDPRLQSFDAEMKIAAQNIGKSLEGGKLTDEDIARYRQMLPNLADTKETAKEKINIINRLIQNKKSSILSSSEKAGYNVSGFNTQVNQSQAEGKQAVSEMDVNSLLSELMGQ